MADKVTITMEVEERDLLVKALLEVADLLETIAVEVSADAPQ